MKGYKRLTDREIAERLKNTVEKSWDSDSLEAQCYIRLAELENKIEDGELISTVQSEQGEQEIAFFVAHNAAVRKQAVKEFAEICKEKFSYAGGTKPFRFYVCSEQGIDEIVKEVCGE